MYLYKLGEIFLQIYNEYISIFLKPGQGYPHKRSGTKKGRKRRKRGRADRGTMLSGMGENRREPKRKSVAWKRGSLDPIRSRNNVSRVSNKRLKLNFVECADPPPLASSPFTPKWILNRVESRSFFDPSTKYRRGLSTGSGGTVARKDSYVSLSLFLA